MMVEEWKKKNPPNPQNRENYYCPGDCSMCGYAEDDVIDEEQSE